MSCGTSLIGAPPSNGRQTTDTERKGREIKDGCYDNRGIAENTPLPSAGIADSLPGAVNQQRVLRNRQVTIFGRNFGITNTEFLAAGSDKIGRQSQAWIRTDGGWKIVSAHVSFGL
jgi:Protein of unknown function (DUF3225)